MDITRKVRKLHTNKKDNLQRFYIPEEMSALLPWEDHEHIVGELGEDGIVVLSKNPNICRCRFLRMPGRSLLTIPNHVVGDMTRVRIDLVNDSLLLKFF